jgi:ankyrin repeat protein
MTDIDWTDIDLLRRTRPALVLETLTDGDGANFKRALESGFDANVFSDYGGSERTAAHHAAAAGDVAVLKLLVEHGANLTAIDPTYNATPLGWAEFFDKPDAAEFLRELS